jgi:hypothetical protein
MENSPYQLGPLLAEIRDGFRGMHAIRRARRAARREEARATRTARTTLKRDLAAYASPRDLEDFEAILDRYSDEETADSRRILAARRVA